MSQKDYRLNQLLRIYIDGIPLDLVSELLGKGTRFNFSLLSHIHLHAKSQKHYEDKTIEIKERKMGKNSFVGLIESLHTGVKKMSWNPNKTEWGEYYSDTNYSETSFGKKKEIISKVIDELKPIEDPFILWFIKLSRPENAPPQINNILVVSTCKNSCCGCFLPP